MTRISPATVAPSLSPTGEMNPPRATRETATHRGRIMTRLPVLAASLFALVSCGPSVPEDLMDRETFIDAYVELRVAALSTDSQRVAASDRDSILDRNGISGDDLLRFVEFHGEDLEFMRDVWNDVELRLDRPPEPTPAEEADASDAPDGAERSGEADGRDGADAAAPDAAAPGAAGRADRPG